MVYTTHKNDDSADGLWNWVNPELGSSCWICLPALTLPVMTAVVKLGTGVGLHGCETIVITAPRWSRPSAQQACAATAGLCLGNLQCNYQFLRKVWQWQQALCVLEAMSQAHVRRDVPWHNNLKPRSMGFPLWVCLSSGIWVWVEIGYTEEWMTTNIN